MALEQLREEMEEQTRWMQPGADGEMARKPSAGGSSLLRSIPVSMEVVIGSLQMTVAQLSELTAGEVVSLHKDIGEPVDLVVNTKKIGQAELTIMDGEPATYGLRIVSLEAEID